MDNKYLCPVCGEKLVFFDGDELAKKRGLKKARKSFIRCPKDVDHFKDFNYSWNEARLLETTFKLDNKEICPNCLIPLKLEESTDSLLCTQCSCTTYYHIEKDNPFRHLYSRYTNLATTYYYNNNQES